jgi:thiol:disulfide interchange protein
MGVVVVRDAGVVRVVVLVGAVVLAMPVIMHAFRTVVIVLVLVFVQMIMFMDMHVPVRMPADARVLMFVLMFMGMLMGVNVLMFVISSHNASFFAGSGIDHHEHTSRRSDVKMAREIFPCVFRRLEIKNKLASVRKVCGAG